MKIASSGRLGFFVNTNRTTNLVSSVSVIPVFFEMAIGASGHLAANAHVLQAVLVLFAGAVLRRRVFIAARLNKREIQWQCVRFKARGWAYKYK